MAARSVEVARSHNVTLHVRSSFEDTDGTWIREEDEGMLEKALISAVVHMREEPVYREERSVYRADAPADEMPPERYPADRYRR